MKNNKWRMFQIIQLILFLGISVFLFFRKVDGSGAENTADVKLINLAIWLGFYLLNMECVYWLKELNLIKINNNMERNYI